MIDPSILVHLLSNSISNLLLDLYDSYVSFIDSYVSFRDLMINFKKNIDEVRQETKKKITFLFMISHGAVLCFLEYCSFYIGRKFYKF